MLTADNLAVVKLVRDKRTGLPMCRLLMVQAAALFLCCFMPSSAFCVDYCFEEAGNQYGVAPELLWSIAKVETPRFDTQAVNVNTNGTYDYCHMQLNSSWAPKLGAEVWASLGVPCQCTKAGAWVLSQCIKNHGYTWEAVGCYHTRNKQKRVQYAWKIYGALVRSANTRATHLSAAADEIPGDRR